MNRPILMRPRLRRRGIGDAALQLAVHGSPGAAGAGAAVRQPGPRRRASPASASRSRSSSRSSISTAGSSTSTLPRWSWCWATRSAWSSMPSPATGSPIRCASARRSGSELAFRGRLEPIVFSALRSVLGEASLFTVLSEDRDGLMKSIQRRGQPGAGPVRHRGGRHPDQAGRPAGREQPGDLPPDADGARAGSPRVARARCRDRPAHPCACRSRAPGADRRGAEDCPRSRAAKATPRRCGSSPRPSGRT